VVIEESTVEGSPSNTIARTRDKFQGASRLDACSRYLQEQRDWKRG
jgi:hypothetical protein